MSDDPALEAPRHGELHRGFGYELFIAALSVLSILNLILLYVIEDAALDSVLYVINVVLTVIFFTDFLLRFTSAQSKSRYFFREFGWADLLASLPFQQAKILRLFRLVKVTRLIEDQGGKGLVRSVIAHRAQSALLTLVLVAILMLEFGSLWMLRLEQDVPGANISNASDSLWYIIVTMATVGYGDEYPITNAGRVLGSLIILIGVGIFGTLTGYLANVFLSPVKKSKPQAAGSPDDVQQQLARLKDMVAQQQAAIAELEGLVNRGK